MVLFPSISIGRVCLFAFATSVVVAAPISTSDETGISELATSNGTDTRELAVLAGRAPGDGTSINNPIDATFSIDGWENTAEFNCWIMLCIHKTRTYRRNSGEQESRQAYTSGGASTNPFYPSNRSTRGTSAVDDQATSAEDFPWRSIRLGNERRAPPNGPPNDTRGLQRYLAGVYKNENDKQGNAIKTGYNKQLGNGQPTVPYEHWFHITFNGNLKPVCEALHKNPPDDSICKDRDYLDKLFGKSVPIAALIFEKNADGQKPIGFHHVYPPGSA